MEISFVVTIAAFRETFHCGVKKYKSYMLKLKNNLIGVTEISETCDIPSPISQQYVSKLFVVLYLFQNQRHNSSRWMSVS